MDALSDVLRFVRLTGGVFLEAEFTAPWCVHSHVEPEYYGRYATNPVNVIAYHFVLEGKLQCSVEGTAPVDLRAGDIVLVPRNEPHKLGSSVHLPPETVDDLVRPPVDEGLARLTYGGGGEEARMICGYLFSEVQHEPLIAMLPQVMSLAARDGPGGAWLESAIRFAGSETAARRAGADTLVSKLSELLFVEAVRGYIESLPPDQTGWLAGLADPTVGRALGLLHGGIAHPWTTEELAGAVNLSRSAFAERFTQLVGDPPMRYLTLWRLRQAQVRLRESHHPIARIAFDVGYESEAAFTRAFKREFGVPPATWRRSSA